MTGGTCGLEDSPAAAALGTKTQISRRKLMIAVFRRSHQAVATSDFSNLPVACFYMEYVDGIST